MTHNTMLPVGQVLARLQDISHEQWATQNDFARYWEASSLKGEAGIDWNDETQRRVFLNKCIKFSSNLCFPIRQILASQDMSKELLKFDSLRTPRFPKILNADWVLTTLEEQNDFINLIGCYRLWLSLVKIHFYRFSGLFL